MKKRDPKDPNNFFYDEAGTNEVTEQIMDSFSSGVVGEENNRDEQNATFAEGQTEL